MDDDPRLASALARTLKLPIVLILVLALSFQPMPAEAADVYPDENPSQDLILLLTERDVPPERAAEVVEHIETSFKRSAVAAGLSPTCVPVALLALALVVEELLSDPDPERVAAAVYLGLGAMADCVGQPEASCIAYAAGLLLYVVDAANEGDYVRAVISGTTLAYWLAHCLAKAPPPPRIDPPAQTIGEVRRLRGG